MSQQYQHVARVWTLHCEGSQKEMLVRFPYVV